MSSYQVGDKVVAKVRGFPFWPAQVTNVSGKNVEVSFYGTGEKGKVNFKNVKHYSEVKETLSAKRKSLVQAVQELENDQTEEEKTVTSSAAKESNPPQNVESTSKPKKKKASKSQDQPNSDAAGVIDSVQIDSKNEPVEPTVNQKRKRWAKQSEEKVSSSTMDAPQNTESKAKKRRGQKADEANPETEEVGSIDSEVKIALVDSTLKGKRKRGLKQAENQHDPDAQGAEKSDTDHPSESNETKSSQNVEVKTKRTRGVKQDQVGSIVYEAQTASAQAEPDQSGDSTIKGRKRKAIKQADDQPVAQEAVSTVLSQDAKNAEMTMKTKRRRGKLAEEMNEPLHAENVDVADQRKNQDKPKRRRAMKVAESLEVEKVEDEPTHMDSEPRTRRTVSSNGKTADKSALKNEDDIIIIDEMTSEDDKLPKTTQKSGRPTKPKKIDENGPKPHSSETNTDDPIKIQEKPKRKREMKAGTLEAKNVEDEPTHTDSEQRARRTVSSNGKTADKSALKNDDDIVIIDEMTSEEDKLPETTKKSGRQPKAQKIDESAKPHSSEKNVFEIERTLMESNYALIEHFKFEDHDITKAITILNDLSKLELNKEILKRQFHIILTIKQLTMYYGKKLQQSRVVRNTANFVLNHLMQYFSDDEDPKETYLKELQEYQKSILSP